ncbi:MAG: hypothetical protein ABR609_14980 [Acidimicrobiia bacterium]
MYVGTYIFSSFAAPAAELDYDLAISANQEVAANFADTGVPAPEATVLDGNRSWAVWPLLAGIGAGALIVALGLPSIRRRRTEMIGGPA